MVTDTWEWHSKYKPVQRITVGNQEFITVASISTSLGVPAMLFITALKEILYRNSTVYPDDATKKKYKDVVIDIEGTACVSYSDLWTAVEALGL